MLQLYKFFKSQQYNFILFGNTKCENTLFFTEIKSSYLLCWGCSFSKLEQTHEDKYLLSTKKESFSQEEDMGNRRAKHTIDKDLSFIHGGGLYKVWKINGR